MAEINVTLVEESPVINVTQQDDAPEIHVQLIGSGPAGRDGADGAPGQDGADGQDGVSPTISSEAITGGHRLTIVDANGTTTVDVMDGQDGAPGQDGQDGADGADGAPGADGADGADGQDGADGATIWHTSAVPRPGAASGIGDCKVWGISDLSGRTGLTPAAGDLVFYSSKYYKIAFVAGSDVFCPNSSMVNLKGDAGSDGTDGVSPEVTIATITGGHSVTITDADHPTGQTFNVMDGTDGTNGQDGAPGAGVASGGTTGQYLKKKSGTDFDTEWDTFPSIPSSASDVGAVASNQGSGNAGKVLGVGNDGTVTPVDGGLSQAAKEALMECFENVAWINSNGQTYYNALASALGLKVLVSISAVFTQGQTVVYDTDSLDSLKSMLVVTATYSDNSTEVIPGTDYTLSGTLTAGTSTITVSYGGKTDTFTVTVSHASPYTFYDYIQGDGTAYINTGLLASTYCTINYEQEVKVAGHNSENGKTVCGARQQWGSANSRLTWHNGATYAQVYCGKDTSYVMSGSGLDVPVIIKTTRDKGIYCDGTLVDTGTGTVTITHTGVITLFAECTSGQGSGYVSIPGTNAYAGAFSKCRIYYFKVWDDNGDLVSYIRPALRMSDSAIGMYDSVRDVFLENARGSGAFSLGNE